MITTLAPPAAAARAGEAAAWIIGALRQSIAATILVLPPTRISSTSRPSAEKYPASLAIQVVAQLAAKLGYRSGTEVAPQNAIEDELRKATNVTSEIGFK